MASVSCGNARNILRFDAAGFHRFIVAAFPVATAANLAAITGQSLRAAQHQVAGEADPSAEALAACIAALGPAFLADVVPGASWARQSARDGEIDDAINVIARVMNDRRSRSSG